MYHWLRSGIFSALIVCAIAVSPSFAKTEQECLNAVEYGTSQIKEKPDDFFGYACRGSAYGELKKYDLAEIDLLKASSIKPHEGGIYTHLATVYFDTRRYDRALKAIRKAISLGKRTQETYNFELAVLNSAEDYNECLRRSKEILKEFAQNSMGYYYSAVSKRKLGDYSKEDIELDLKNAVKFDPKNRFAIDELQWVRTSYRPKNVLR